MEVPEAFQGIAKQIEQAFKSLNVEKFGEVGDVFSPHLHEALGNDAVEKGNEDTVTAVLEVGYRSGEAVLRHAKVRVGVSEA